MKIVLGLAVIMAIWFYYLNWRVDNLLEENKRMAIEINSLKTNNERIVKNEMEVRRQNESLKKQVAEDKSGFDWYYDLSGNPVRLRMSNECLSCDRTD